MSNERYSEAVTNYVKSMFEEAQLPLKAPWENARHEMAVFYVNKAAVSEPVTATKLCCAALVSAAQVLGMRWGNQLGIAPSWKGPGDHDLLMAFRYAIYTILWARTIGICRTYWVHYFPGQPFPEPKKA